LPLSSSRMINGVQRSARTSVAFATGQTARRSSCVVGSSAHCYQPPTARAAAWGG
jgi:hypothetical protein